MFPEWFIQVLIYGSIILTAAGVITLLTMLYKDWRANQLW